VITRTYQSALVPGDTLALVGIGIGVAVDGTSLAAEEAVKRWADLVAACRVHGVALSATSLEEVGTFLGVTYGRDQSVLNQRRLPIAPSQSWDQWPIQNRENVAVSLSQRPTPCILLILLRQTSQICTES
jgi:hypothetical protein